MEKISVKNVFNNWNSYLAESHSKEDGEELKKISDELKGAVKMHQNQADRIDTVSYTHLTLPTSELV